MRISPIVTFHLVIWGPNYQTGGKIIIILIL